MIAPVSGYRPWPAYRAGLEDLDWKNGRGVALAEMVLAVGLAFPPVVSVVGEVSLEWSWLLVAHVLCFAVLGGPVHRAAQKRPWVFHAQVAASLLSNVLVLLGLVVVGGQPLSLTWLGLLLYSAVLGSSQELEPTWAYLGTVVLAPLSMLVYFAHHPTGTYWDWLAPPWMALLDGVAYHGLATVSARWRAKRAELMQRIAELERAQLARELHDSVGSTLTLLALYGDLVQRHADRPEELRQIGGELRAAASDGLLDLRGVIDALSPEACDAAGLAQTMRRHIQRAGASGPTITFEVQGDPTVGIDGPIRLALLRVLQEAITNALRHAHAASIAARLVASDELVTLEVTDDGTGVSATPTEGHGLSNMRARAKELEAQFDVDASPGRGTRLRFVVAPRRRATREAAA